MSKKKDKVTTDKDIQQSIEEADVLRRILKGQPLTPGSGHDVGEVDRRSDQGKET